MTTAEVIALLISLLSASLSGFAVYLSNETKKNTENHNKLSLLSAPLPAPTSQLRVASRLAADAGHGGRGLARGAEEGSSRPSPRRNIAGLWSESR
jgi:hypothetical protein